MMRIDMLLLYAVLYACAATGIAGYALGRLAGRPR